MLRTFTSGEADNVGEEHGDVVVVISDRLLAIKHAVGDLRRENVVQDLLLFLKAGELDLSITLRRFDLLSMFEQHGLTLGFGAEVFLLDAVSFTVVVEGTIGVTVGGQHSRESEVCRM